MVWAWRRNIVRAYSWLGIFAESIGATLQNALQGRTYVRGAAAVWMDGGKAERNVAAIGLTR